MASVSGPIRFDLFVKKNIYIVKCRILSGVKGGSTADVCAVRRSSFLQSGFFVVFPDSRHSLASSNSLTTLNCLSPITTLCLCSRIVLSFRAAIIYFVFCSFIFYPTLSASLSNAK
jgi:hypothetical protein